MGYWENRQAQLMYEQMEKAEKTAKEIADLYAKASRELNDRIETIFEKYRDKWSLSNEDAKALLNTVKDKEGIQALQQALMDLPDNKGRQELLQQLESPAYRARIERLQSLQTEIDNMMQNIYKQEQVVSTAHYIDTAAGAYYNQIYAVQRQVGFQFSFSSIDPKALNKVLESNWNGENYSKRIWDNTSQLAGDLKEQLMIDMLTGKRLDDVAADIQQKYEVGAFKARRLIRTESCFLNSQMQMEAYKECDAEYYEYVATLDSKTDEECGALDGQRFKVSEGVPGINMPPMHPFCRCTTIISLDGPTESSLQRRAKNPERSKKELVPADTTYAEWYKQNVSGNPKAELAMKKSKNLWTDQRQYERYKETLGKKAGKTFEQFQEMKYNSGADEWNQAKSEYRKVNAYNKTLEKEPAITEALKKISDTTGTEMVGLEHKTKTKTSFLRKIADDTENSTDAKVIMGAIDDTHDVIRYTYQAEAKSLVESYKNVVNEMEAAGFNLSRVKNTWLNKRSAYKGINCVFQTSEGTKFEVQFHTPESFAVKNGKQHKLYEEFRKSETSKERKMELTKQMFEESKDLEMPEGIETIESTK